MACGLGEPLLEHPASGPISCPESMADRVWVAMPQLRIDSSVLWQKLIPITESEVWNALHLEQTLTSGDIVSFLLGHVKLRLAVTGLWHQHKSNTICCDGTIQHIVP